MFNDCIIVSVIVEFTQVENTEISKQVLKSKLFIDVTNIENNFCNDKQ